VPVFFDTNVLVYCTDALAPAKRERAKSLVAQASATGEAVISTQVLIELFHALTRKQGIPATTARALVEAFLVWPVVDSDVALVAASIDRSTTRQTSIWDAMVIEAALRAGAHTLYTEDLSDGHRIGPLTVVNPFAA
jgi:predicted nucleic acid-binding protein